jgi:hypothetical protein
MQKKSRGRLPFGKQPLYPIYLKRRAALLPFWFYVKYMDNSQMREF